MITLIFAYLVPGTSWDFFVEFRIMFIDMNSAARNHMIVLHDYHLDVYMLYTGIFLEFDALKANTFFRDIRPKITKIFIDSVIEKRSYNAALDVLVVRIK